MFQLFINNEFVNSASGKTFPTVNPCTGKTIVQVQEADKVSQLSIHSVSLKQPLVSWHISADCCWFEITGPVLKAQDWLWTWC